MFSNKVPQKKKDNQPNNKTTQLLAKWMLQRSVGDPEAKNTEYQLLAEENKVTDLSSFINEIEYRWKGNPWLGGYNPTLERIYNTPKPINAPFEKLIKLFKPAKKQQGGQLNMNEQELQQAFIQFLAQKTGAKTQQELEAAIQQLGEEGLKQAYAEFMQLIQQQQVQAAKFGAKINYIKKLRGQCPDGYELQYYKAGGQLCKKCMKKQVMQDGGDLPQDPIDQFKCGRKMKKKKCEAGGTVDMDKCGAKMKKKKCENGGFIPFDKCGKKMKYEGGKKFPLIEKGKDGKNKTIYYKDEATRDSIAANKYNDQEVQTTKPGSYKKGKWTPDRSKYPYKKK